MARYRHTVTGGERESSRLLGFPWEPVSEKGSKSSDSKPAKGSRAQAAEKGEAVPDKPEKET
jgi:hypothetical protein